MEQMRNPRLLADWRPGRQATSCCRPAPPAPAVWPPNGFEAAEPGDEKLVNLSRPQFPYFQLATLSVASDKVHFGRSPSSPPAYLSGSIGSCPPANGQRRPFEFIGRVNPPAGYLLPARRTSFSASKFTASQIACRAPIFRQILDPPLRRAPFGPLEGARRAEPLGPQA